MILKKTKGCYMDARLASAGAKVIRGQSGEAEQAAGAIRLGKRPRQRAKRKRRVVGLDCLEREHGLINTGCDGGQQQVAKRVLVVEDNELNLKLFCDLLRAHEFAAEPVRDGRDALARARDFDPELIIMDIQMPHVSGYELIEALKADDVLRRIPIIAVTAYAGRDDEDRIRAAGADAYVSKPISLARFVQEVSALMPETVN